MGRSTFYYFYEKNLSAPHTQEKLEQIYQQKLFNNTFKKNYQIQGINSH